MNDAKLHELLDGHRGRRLTNPEFMLRLLEDCYDVDPQVVVNSLDRFMVAYLVSRMQSVDLGPGIEEQRLFADRLYSHLVRLCSPDEARTYLDGASNRGRREGRT